MPAAKAKIDAFTLPELNIDLLLFGILFGIVTNLGYCWIINYHHLWQRLLKG